MQTVGRRETFGGRGAGMAGASTAARLVRLLERIQDPEIGLIRYLAEIPLQPSEPDLYFAVAQFQDPFAIRYGGARGRAPDIVTQSSGAALDRTGALWAAVGEAIERYALHAYESVDFLFAPAVALDGEYLSPLDLILFSAEQYARRDWPYRGFDPTRPINWVCGVRLDTNSRAYVPASLAYLGFEANSDAERLDAGYSTGAAAGEDFATAALTGLLEIIERDCFACHWYLRRTPAAVDSTILARLPDAIVSLLESAALQVRVLDITTDIGVCAALALARTRDGRGVPIGAAARLSMEQAIAKATIEAFHTYNWILDLIRNGVAVPKREDIRGFRDHVAFYLDPNHGRLLEFLFRSERPPPFPHRLACGGPAEERLAVLVQHLRARGHLCFAVDITPPEVGEERIRVVKTFITGLHPLGCGHDREHRDPRRLRAFAGAAGHAWAGALNLDPHPFP